LGLPLDDPEPRLELAEPGFQLAQPPLVLSELPSGDLQTLTHAQTTFHDPPPSCVSVHDAMPDERRETTDGVVPEGSRPPLLGSRDGGLEHGAAARSDTHAHAVGSPASAGISRGANRA